MNQIYFVLQRPFGYFAKKLVEDFTAFQSPWRSNKSSYFTALLAVMLFSCFGAYAQNTYYSLATATDFNDVNSWGTAPDGTGTAPAAISNADNFIVANNAALVLSGNAAVRQLTLTAGSLAISSNALTMGIAGQKNAILLINGGTLNMSGGTLNIDGHIRFNSGNFNQSGGAIVIDPNNAGAVATSTTSAMYTLELRAAVNWTGGTITLLDPPASTSSSHYSLYYNAGTTSEVSTSHTLVFGDGTSADASGHANGFYIYNWVGAGKLNLGNVAVYGPSAGNRRLRLFNAYGIIGNLTLYTGAELDNNASTLSVAGNIDANAGSIWTASGTTMLAKPSGTTNVVNPNPQTLTLNGTLRNNATTITAEIASLTINNSSTAGVTPSRDLKVSGTLTLTSGIINTTAATVLTLGTDTAAGTLSGGSATSYVNGPLTRTIGNANTATNYIVFPVGKNSVYAPIHLAPVTTAVSKFKVEAFDNNSGTAGANATSLSTAKRWEAPLLSGSFTTINVRIPDAALIADNIPVMANAAAGAYAAAFGTTSVFTTGTPNIIQGLNPVATADYTGFLSYAKGPLCTGVPAPGATISSAAGALCAGTTVVFSVANATTGTGVTYQWQSSADGMAFTDIAGATAATYSTVPAAALYYRLKVTCATGPDSAESTPVQVTFTNVAPVVTNAVKCGEGTLTLGASTSYPNGFIEWYDAQTAGNLLSTENEFTTPLLTATATYYAAAVVPSAGTVALGTATTTTSSSGVTPFTTNYEGSRSQYLIRASELKALGLVKGNITSMAFDVTIADPYIQKGYTVKIIPTIATALTAFVAGTATTVYGPVDKPAATVGLNTFAFTTPFYWDGTANIVIEICTDNDTSPASCTNCYGAVNTTVRYTPTSFNSVFARYADNNVVCGSATAGSSANNSNRPNIVLAGQLGCSSPRVPVTATIDSAPVLTLGSTSASICNGTATPAINVTAGATDFDTFVWSPSAGVSGSISTGYTFNPLVSTTYTLTATQASGAQCVGTATFNVTVNEMPTAVTITSDAPAGACAGTIYSLTAAGGLTSQNKALGTDTVLNSTTGYPSPYSNFYGGLKQQVLIRASELTAMGFIAGTEISKLAFTVAAVGPNFSGTLNNFQIDMGHTSANALTGTAFVSGLTNVLPPATVSIPLSGFPVSVSHTLAAPFTWNGTDNVVIQTFYNNGNSGTNQMYVQVHTSNAGFNASNWNAQDSATNNAVLTATTPNVSSPSQSRPNITLTAKLPTAPVWSPDTNLYTDASATTAYVAGAPASKVYVKGSAAGTTVYTAKITTAQNCSVEATQSVTLADCGIQWGSIQWPATGTITTCGTHSVYGRVYKAGITEATGANSALKAWIGVSATNTDPATWAEAQWTTATFNGEYGNDDEYKGDITGLAAGTYYYAFRYQYQTGAFLYGGHFDNVGDTEGGPWGGQNISGVLTVNGVALPTAANQAVCQGKTVADLAVTGTAPKWYTVATNGTALASTDAVTAGTYYVSQTIDNCESARVEVVVTISSFDAPVVNVTQPTCTSATATVTVTSLGADYTYSINGTDFDDDLVFTNVAPGAYTVTAKNLLGCTMSSAVTVNEAPSTPATPVVIVTQPTCSTAGSIVILSPTGTGIEYSIGDDYQSSAIFADVAPGNYTVTVRNGGGCTNTGSAIIINPAPTAPDAENVADVSACDTYTLPALPAGNNYYTATNAGGTMLNAGSVINMTQTVYVYAGSAGCSDEESFIITITQSPDLGTVANVTSCGSYSLPARTVGSYYTGPGGTGTELLAGSVIATDQTVYIYAVNGTNPACSSGLSFNVVITTAPAQPAGDPIQSVTVADAADATIEDLVATAATGTISWYATEADALAGTAALAEGTQLISGETYYATAAVGTCRSTTALAVEVSVTLGSDEFSFTNLKYYPNPVADRLTITHSSAITLVEVYNLLGQLVISERPGTSTTEVNMGNLQQATYIVKVSADGRSKDFKVIKK